MKEDKITFTKLQTRSIINENKQPEYVVKGYAVIPELQHTYKYQRDKFNKVTQSMKSLFTKQFETSMLDQLKHKKVFIDIEHELASKLSIRQIVDQIVDKAKEKGLDFDQAKNMVDNYLNVPDMPMFKVKDFNVDDNGLLIELRGNPFYKELSADHAKYFDAVWHSLEDKFIDGMSINFVATDVTQEQDGIEKINDGEVYGISLTSGASISGADITEVAMRAIQNFKEGETKMEGEPQEPVQPQEPTQPQESDELKLKLEKLEAENTQMKQEKIDNEKQEHTDLMTNMQNEITALKEQLKQNKSTQQQSIVQKQEPDYNGQQQQMSQKEIQEKLKDISFGEALQLSADFKLNQHLPPETRFYAEKGSDDIIVNQKDTQTRG